jgi:pyridoxamine 5'-phosphate oxidase
MELDEATDPFDLFDAWYEAAKAAEPFPADPIALATVDAGGQPSVRMVLLKAADRRGFVFYTNLESRKGCDLKADPKAAICLYWPKIKRQIRVEGSVEPVAAAEADAYYASRPRDSRIGAWASDQSRPLDSRATLLARVAAIEARYPGEDVPRPPNWSGLRLVANRLEFWAERPFRLHDRVVFSRQAEGWERTRLYP